MSSWLNDSSILQGFTCHGGGWVTGGLDEILNLQPGDVVWIGKQRDRPEVKTFVHSFLADRPHDRIVGRIDRTWPPETPFG